MTDVGEIGIGVELQIGKTVPTPSLLQTQLLDTFSLVKVVLFLMVKFVQMILEVYLQFQIILKNGLLQQLDKHIRNVFQRPNATCNCKVNSYYFSLFFLLFGK